MASRPEPLAVPVARFVYTIFLFDFTIYDTRMALGGFTTGLIGTVSFGGFGSVYI